MSRKYFGTDGVRGQANTEPMTTDTVMRLGRAAAYRFKTDVRRHRILIGKDTRRSGYMLEFALSAGICSAGVDTLLLGPLPTPGVAFLARDMRADAGVMISASHNPFEDNGIKFFDRRGYKLPDDVEERIEEIMDSRQAEENPVTAGEVGRAWRIDDAVGRYIVFLKKSFPADLTLEGVKIVLDCANGAAYKVAPAVFEELGATVHVIGNKPDGKNINDRCGAMHPETMAELVREQGADLGIALDGDADRLVLVDERGRTVTGDHVMAAIGRHMLAENRLKKNTVVATVMSNMGLEASLRAVGGNVVRSGVGDRYVIELMQTEGYNFGGEQSGHFIFGDEHTTGDGILSALQVLAYLVKRQAPLSTFFDVMTVFPQITRSMDVREKIPFEHMPEVARRISAAQQTLGGAGRILVRYSGTETKARVMVEGENEDVILRLCDDIQGAIEREIGV